MYSEWLAQIQQTIETEKEKIHKRDLKFFQVDQLFRIAKRLDHFGKDCQECERSKTELESLSSSLSEYINGTSKQKRQLEKQTDTIKKHLKTEHQIYPVYYFVSYYSFLGLALGVVFGLLTGLLFSSYFYQSIVAEIIIGLGTGYFKGTKKDWEVRREKRLL